MNVKDPSQGEPTLLAAKLETLEQVTLVIRIWKYNEVWSSQNNFFIYFFILILLPWDRLSTGVIGGVVTPRRHHMMEMGPLSD